MSTSDSEHVAVPDDPVALSGAYLRAVRTGGDADRLRRALADLDPERLVGDLSGDGSRKAFWLNVYNATVQETLARDPDRYGSRRRFFSSDIVTVAGRQWSPDDVEHGVLRRSQPAWGLGYLRKPDFLVDGFVKRLRVDAVDPRIHFALNCGAASCPPIAAYSRAGVDDELDLATRSFFETDVEYDPDAGRVYVPRLLLWYRGDFGGRAGIYRFLRDHGAIPADAKPRVTYREYDWSLSLEDYSEPDPDAGDD